MLFRASFAASCEGRKEILPTRATTKVDGHVNVLSKQINGSPAVKNAASDDHTRPVVAQMYYWRPAQ